MDCREIQEKLHQLADGESPAAEEAHLRRHVAACPACAAIHDGILRLKALVRRAGSGGRAPAELSSAVRSDLRELGARRRPLALRWAAAAAALITAFLVVEHLEPFGWWSESLAHAAVIRQYAREYESCDRSRFEPVLAMTDPDYRPRVREDVARIMGAECRLVWVPLLKSAMYCGARPYSCAESGKRIGARLDYIVELDGKQHPLCVFVLFLDAHPLGDRLRREVEECATPSELEPHGHDCDCAGEQGSTVYCVVRAGCRQLFSFVSDIEPHRLHERIEPHLCKRER